MGFFLLGPTIGSRGRHELVGFGWLEVSLAVASVRLVARLLTLVSSSSSSFFRWLLLLLFRFCVCWPHSQIPNKVDDQM